MRKLVRIAERHFFLLEPETEGLIDLSERWSAGEDDPAEGGDAQRWTCWWMPLTQAPVPAAGLGARIGVLCGG